MFSHITDSQSAFCRYGRKVMLHEIFEVSGILGELRDAVVQGNERVKTCISFSPDISAAARVVFLKQVLEINGFEILQSSAHIGHLALEHALKGHRIEGGGCYLVLNACNENLHYALYQHDTNLFLRLADGKLDGMGTDPRGRALVEDVVNKINRTQRFLSTPEEKEKKYCNLLQHAEHWLGRIDNVRFDRPVRITNIRLSCVPNLYEASVVKSEIDQRTAAIVKDVVRVVVQFVRQHLPHEVQLQGVLLVGDAFSNQQFRTALAADFVLAPEAYVHIRHAELARVVAVYDYIDGQQFSTEEQKAITRGTAELARIKMAQDEQAKLEEAERQLAEQREAEYKLDEATRKYREAIEKVYDFEKKGNYDEMKDWATIALTQKPGDEEAQQKLDEATRLLSEAKVRMEQYNNIIHRAQQAYDEHRWQDVLSLADSALNLRPDSQQAKSLREEARRQLDNLQLVDKHLTRADLFLAQKSYKEAQEELDKVLHLAPQHEEALSRKAEIDHQAQALAQQIAQIKQQLREAEAQNDYDAAISLAQQLGEIDSSHQQLWGELAAQLRAAQAKAQKMHDEFKQKKQEFSTALFEGMWEKAVNLGEQLIALVLSLPNLAEEKAELERNLNRARARWEEVQEEARYKNEVLQFKSFMADKMWQAARNQLKALRHAFPEHLPELKMLSAQLFEAEEKEEHATQLPPTQPKKSSTDDERVVIDGFGPRTNPRPRKADYDDFFDAPARTSKKKPLRTGGNAGKKQDDDDDFFNSSTRQAARSSQSTKRPSASPQRKRERFEDDDDFFNSPSPRNAQSPSSSKKGRVYDPFFDDDIPHPRSSRGNNQTPS